MGKKEIKKTTHQSGLSLSFRPRAATSLFHFFSLTVMALVVCVRACGVERCVYLFPLIFTAVWKNIVQTESPQLNKLPSFEKVKAENLNQILLFQHFQDKTSFRRTKTSAAASTVSLKGAGLYKQPCLLVKTQIKQHKSNTNTRLSCKVFSSSPLQATPRGRCANDRLIFPRYITDDNFRSRRTE